MSTGTMLLAFAALGAGAGLTTLAMQGARTEWGKLGTMALGMLISVMALGFVLAAAMLRGAP